MQTVAILNSKGGSGKTTVSINLASYFAETGQNTVLIDYDSQGSSTHWVDTRDKAQPLIHCIPAFRQPVAQTRSFQMKLPSGTERVIIDTPASVTQSHLENIVKRADFIIIPVLPSSIDIHAVTGFIEQLHRLKQINWRDTELAVVASRVKENTKIFATLEQYLKNLDIPFVAKIRDTQNYIHSTNEGKGLFEVLPQHKVARDKFDWYPLINWIEKKEIFTELDHDKTETLVQAV